MKTRLRQTGHHREQGIVAVWVAIAATVIFGVGAFAVDVARWYVEAERLQKTVDSASTSGVVYLPADVSGGYDTAQDIAQRNGWTIDGADVTFDAQQLEDRPTRLRVTMSSNVDNTFGRLLGVDATRITRTAVADYGAPSAVGNPCNVYGNQEMEDPSDRVDGSNCLNNGGYWLNMAGDNTNKARGDGYGSGWCTKPDVNGGTIDRCHSVNNNQANPGLNADHSTASGSKTFPGYVFNVRAAESGNLRLSGYDLGWVATGDHCTVGLAGATTTNAYVTDTAEAALRYGTGRTGGAGTETPSHSFCAGDTEMAFPEGDRSPVQTTITVRRPSPNPWQPLAGEVYCTQTLSGWGQSTPASALATDADLARTFHRWSGLCGQDDVTSIPVQAGEDWVIQVQTSGQGGARGGGGQNRFALRAELGSGGGDLVNIYAVDKFSIFVNKDIDTSDFNIIRLDSSTAGKTMEIQIFDIGDAAQVTAQVRKPDGTAFTDCEFEGPIQSPNPATCQFTTRASQSGGYWLTVRAPIPDTYTCPEDSDLTQCWVSLNIVTANPADTTTWTARVIGDPVRIVE